MRTRRIVGGVTLLGTASVLVALTLPALAGTTGTRAAKPKVPSAADALAAGSAQNLLAAMSRDLQITPDAALRRLNAENAVNLGDSQLAELGEAYAGSWFSPVDSKLVVAITDADSAQLISSLGAEPRVVSRTLTQLDTAKDQLDATAAPSGVQGWYVDPTTNSVQVLAKQKDQNLARTFARKAGVAAAAVQVTTVPDDFRVMFDLRGGDAYNINRVARCSIGFPVTTGFISAGHCGQKGSSTVGFNKAAQGTFRTSFFGNGAGNDYSVIDVNGKWAPKAVVHTPNGDVPIAGSKEAPVNASVCRTGSTTGTHCGTIKSRTASINVSGRIVKNFILTNACAQPGDSGGSLMAGNQAQGTLTGGSGSCRGGSAITVYQPINPVLSAEHLKLVTTSGSQSAPAKPATKPATKPAAKPATTTVSRFAATVATLVNQQRAKAGCGALTVNAKLTKAAQAHSADMAAHNYFSHTDLQGHSPSQRVDAVGYSWRMTGENIAAGQADPQTVMTAWMNSPGHRANILNCGYKDLGVGVAMQGNTPFWTQDFGTPR